MVLLHLDRRDVDGDRAQSVVGGLDCRQEVVLSDSEGHCSGLADQHPVDYGMVRRGSLALSLAGTESTSLLKGTISKGRMKLRRRGRRVPSQPVPESVLSPPRPLTLHTENSHRLVGDDIVPEEKEPLFFI